MVAFKRYLCCDHDVASLVCVCCGRRDATRCIKAQPRRQMSPVDNWHFAMERARLRVTAEGLNDTLVEDSLCGAQGVLEAVLLGLAMNWQTIKLPRPGIGRAGIRISRRLLLQTQGREQRSRGQSRRQ